MVELFAINKLYKDGTLFGYTVLDTSTRQSMNVTKEALKQAVINKQVNVVNLTLTSDGRLLGDASLKAYKRYTAPVKAPATPKSNNQLLEIYNNGKRICMVKQSINGVESFENGLVAQEKIEKKFYNNVRYEDDKPVLKEIKKKPFKGMKNKIIKQINSLEDKVHITANTSDVKKEYNVEIDGASNPKSMQLIYSLIIDCCITERIKVLYVNDKTVRVQSMTNIKDLRAALKEIKEI